MEEQDQVGLTEKQQFWLDHLRKCQAGHGTIKAYTGRLQGGSGLASSWQSRRLTQ